MPKLHGRDAEKKWRELAGGAGTPGKDGNGITSAVLNDDYTLTLTFTDGTEYTTPSIRGGTGAPGADGADGETPEVTVLRSDSGDGVGRGFAIVTFTLGGESQSFTVWDGYPGADGRPGVGIKSIEKISTDGLVDTYKINYTPIGGGGASVDPTYFSVTNGKDGTPYVPTEADKTAIAQEAAKLVDVPVKSVNGKTGAVKLGAADVGAATTAQFARLSEEIADLETVKVLTQAEYNATSAEDFAAMYEGGVRILGITEGYTNLVPLSTNESGIIYRGCGYRNGYRIKSDGTITAFENECVSGYMPYRHGAVLRVVGSAAETALSAAGQYIAVYGADFSVINVELQTVLVSSGKATWTARSDGRYELTVDTSKVSAWSGASYMRVSNYDCTGADMIVTLDEVIGEVSHE